MPTLISTIVAHACPDCAPVRAARAAITEDPDRWFYLIATLSPFLVVALVVAALHRLGRPPPPTT